MTIWRDSLATHKGDRIATGVAIANGLMRGDAENLQRGYTAANAILAVIDLANASGEPLTSEEAGTILLEVRLLQALAYYRAHTGVATLDDMRKAYERTDFHTLAELDAFRHADLHKWEPTRVDS